MTLSMMWMINNCVLKAFGSLQSPVPISTGANQPTVSTRIPTTVLWWTSSLQSSRLWAVAAKTITFHWWFNIYMTKVREHFVLCNAGSTQCHILEWLGRAISLTSRRLAIVKRECCVFTNNQVCMFGWFQFKICEGMLLSNCQESLF